MHDMKDRITRRRFLKLAGGFTLALATGCSSRKAAETVTRPIQRAVESLAGIKTLEARFVRQIITADSRTSRTIMWQSDEPQEDAFVEWRAKDGGKSVTVPAASEHYTDDGQNVWLHSARIEGLTPGRAYTYRLAEGEALTGWYALRAENGGDFKALIFPDSQSSDYSDWTSLVEGAVQRNPDAAFFVNMGDLVDNGEDQYQWNAWFDAVEELIGRVPFAPIMGNHETYDRSWTERLPLAYLALFDVPGNGSGDFPRYYYSFDFGDVHFVVLNTVWQEIDDIVPGLRDEQLAWLPQDIAATDKKWKVVLTHRDVLHYRIAGRPERLEGISEEGIAFMPLFDELGVDAVLTAHLHTYRNRGHIRDFEHDPTGPLYILTGVAGNVRYPGLWLDHALDEFIAPQPETDNYLTLEASADALRFRCFLPDGSCIDDVTVSK